MGDQGEHSVNTTRDPSAPAETERTPESDPLAEPAVPTPAPHAQRELGSTGTLAFSAVVGRAPEAQDGPARPEPARGLDAAQMAVFGQAPPAPAQRFVARADTTNTTLQSMIRPDLMAHGLSDPRRFLSIERELSEASASIRFLEKRLNRLERDGRFVLALAAVAVLFAALGFLL